MMRRLAILTPLALAGCSAPHGPPSAAYRDIDDQLSVALGIDRLIGPGACYREDGEFQGQHIHRFIGSRQCYRFKPPERIDAIWRYHDGASLLLTPAEAARGARPPGVRIRVLDIDYREMAKAICPERAADCDHPDFHIVFIGRRTAVDGGYGVGDVQEVVVLDRLISAESWPLAKR